MTLYIYILLYINNPAYSNNQLVLRSLDIIIIIYLIYSYGDIQFIILNMLIMIMMIIMIIIMPVV